MNNEEHRIDISLLCCFGSLPFSFGLDSLQLLGFCHRAENLPHLRQHPLLFHSLTRANNVRDFDVRRLDRGRDNEFIEQLTQVPIDLRLLLRYHALCACYIGPSPKRQVGRPCHKRQLHRSVTKKEIFALQIKDSCHRGNHLHLNSRHRASFLLCAHHQPDLQLRQ